MDSKEEEANRWEGQHPPPPPYTGPYEYPPQGQPVYPPQQVPPQHQQIVYSQAQSQYGQPAQYGQPVPQYSQPVPQYGQPMPQYGQPVPHYGQPMQQYGQPQVMVSQPGQHVIIVAAAPISNPPPDHLVFNIVMTLFCCWPIGICAIMKSLECRTAVQSGDRVRADSLSQSARRLGIWTLGIGIITVGSIFIAMIVGVIA